MNKSPANLGSPSKRPPRQLRPIHGLAGDFGGGKKRFRLQARVGQPPQSLSKFPASLRGRRPDAALFDDHRRQHASPIAIITKRLEKLPIALVLWVLQATTDPDLGVVKRALGLITLGPHCPQMRFDKNAIRDRCQAGLGVGWFTRVGFLPAYPISVRIPLLS